MILLSLVVALILVRGIQTSNGHPIQSLKPQNWWMGYWHSFWHRFSWLEKYPAFYGFLVAWLLPSAVVGTVSWMLTPFLHGGLHILFGALVLWACLPDFSELLPHDRDMDTLLVNAHENLFAVVFWFVLLGPAGGLMYYTLNWLCKTAETDPALARFHSAIRLIHRWLAWVPVRLTGLFFALVGHFDTGFTEWRKMAFNIEADSEKLLVACGRAALALELTQGEKEPAVLAHILVERASFVWLIVLAVLSFNI